MNKEFTSERVRRHLPWADFVIFVHCSMMFIKIVMILPM